jgi:asparaginyl-tRNA synthetase
MSTIYIDESKGSDTTGDGSQTSPYLSLGYAMFTNGVDNVKFLIRKDDTVKYDAPTQSATKRAKKAVDGLEKKKKKAEELAAKEADKLAGEKEKREKLLEESKKIVLEEDPALPKASRVRVLLLLL